MRSPDPMIPRTELDKVCRTHLRAEGPKSVGCVMNEGCETPSTVERGFENRCESAELPEKCRGPIVCVLFVRGSSDRARFCPVESERARLLCERRVSSAEGVSLVSSNKVTSEFPGDVVYHGRPTFRGYSPQGRSCAGSKFAAGACRA